MNQAGAYEQFRNFRDDDLIRIAHSVPEDGFEPDAVASAMRELERRNVTTEAIADTTEQAARDRDAEDLKAHIPLSNLGWIAFILVGPIFLIPISAAAIYRTRGYRQKSKDVLSAILPGVLLYGLISAAFSYLAP